MQNNTIAGTHNIAIAISFFISDERYILPFVVSANTKKYLFFSLFLSSEIDASFVSILSLLTEIAGVTTFVIVVTTFWTTLVTATLIQRVNHEKNDRMADLTLSKKVCTS